MIIKVEVDLKDFYDEGEEISFSQSIKGYIAGEVRHMVMNDFRAMALDETLRLVREKFQKEREFEINKIVEEIFSTKEIKKQDRKGPDGKTISEMVTVKKYIEDRISQDYFSETKNAESVLNSWIDKFKEKFNTELKSCSEQIGKDLKDRYDLLFASQIVSKLNENGMLREDVAKLLLPKE